MTKIFIIKKILLLVIILISLLTNNTFSAPQKPQEGIISYGKKLLTYIYRLAYAPYGMLWDAIEYNSWHKNSKIIFSYGVDKNNKYIVSCFFPDNIKEKMKSLYLVDNGTELARTCTNLISSKKKYIIKAANDNHADVNFPINPFLLSHEFIFSNVANAVKFINSLKQYFDDKRLSCLSNIVNVKESDFKNNETDNFEMFNNININCIIPEKHKNILSLSDGCNESTRKYLTNKSKDKKDGTIVNFVSADICHANYYSSYSPENNSKLTLIPIDNNQSISAQLQEYQATIPNSFDLIILRNGLCSCESYETTTCGGLNRAYLSTDLENLLTNLNDVLEGEESMAILSGHCDYIDKEKIKYGVEKYNNSKSGVSRAKARLVYDFADRLHGVVLDEKQ